MLIGVSCIPSGWLVCANRAPIPAFAGTSIVVRAGWKGARWLDTKGKPLDLLAALAAAANAGVLDCPIWIGRKKAPPLALRSRERLSLTINVRSVAFRKPAAAAEISQAKARPAAEWVILVTSLKAQAWSSAEIGDLYRARWRIEMAFKRLKSILGLEGPPGEDPKVAKTPVFTGAGFGSWLIC